MIPRPLRDALLFVGMVAAIADAVLLASVALSGLIAGCLVVLVVVADGIEAAIRGRP